MGLDSVELLLATEEEFGIVIDDADAANLATPRMLADYVVSRLGVASSDKQHCLSSAAFYRIRSTLIEQFGAARKDVRPDSRIEHWLGADVRRQWRKLAASAGMAQLPALRCRRAIYYPLTLGVPLLLASLSLLAGLPVWAAPLAFVSSWLAANIVAGNIADQIPPGASTVAELVPYVRPSRKEDWSPDYVLHRVLQITSLQLGIPVDRIHPDNHFVKDLGID